MKRILIVIGLMMAGVVALAQDAPQVTTAWVTTTNTVKRWHRIEPPLDKNDVGPVFHVDRHPENYQQVRETTVASNLVQTTVYKGATNTAVLDTVPVSQTNEVWAFQKAQ